MQSLENTLHQSVKYTIFNILYTRVRSISILKPHQNVNSQLEFAFNNNKKNNRSVSRLLPNFHSFVLVLPHFPVSSVYLLIFPIFSFYIFILPVSSVYLFIFPYFCFLSFYPSHSILFISLTFSPSFRQLEPGLAWLGVGGS